MFYYNLKIMKPWRDFLKEILEMNYRYWMKTMFDLEVIQRNQVDILNRVGRLEEVVF